VLLVLLHHTLQLLQVCRSFELLHQLCAGQLLPTLSGQLLLLLLLLLLLQRLLLAASTLPPPRLLPTSTGT
jgi:hypothetical protein